MHLCYKLKVLLQKGELSVWKPSAYSVTCWKKCMSSTPWYNFQTSYQVKNFNMIQVNTFLVSFPDPSKEERESGDIWPIPLASLTLNIFWEEFSSANLNAESTICGCNTGNPWLLQHNHNSFFGTEKISYQCSLQAVNFDKAWGISQMPPVVGGIDNLMNLMADHTARCYCFVFLGQWDMQTSSDISFVPRPCERKDSSSCHAHNLGTRLLLHVLCTVAMAIVPS